MRVILVLGLALLLAGCSIADTAPLAPAGFRQLTAKEKAVVAEGFARTAPKDAGTRQFKWMPIPMTLPDGGHWTTYCGLVSGKNADGSDSFMPYYANLDLDPQGLIRHAELREIERPADDVSAQRVLGTCYRSGYVDFSLAR
jgi:hypothetical protein